MEKTFIGVRDVDEETFRKFRILALERKIKLGKALSLAMKKFLKERKTKKKELVGVKSLLQVKPFDWGPGTEKTSKEVDEILYGLKK